MRGPPEPALQVPLGPAGAAVGPEMREELLEQIGAVDLQVEVFELAQAAVLRFGEIPGILQPDEARLVHQRLVRRSLLADLVAADLVDRLHEMTHDVELVEHQHRLACSVLDDVDVRLPHIAADACEGRCFLRAEEVEERVEGVRRASLPAPHQPLAREVVDVGDVDVPALSGDLINADVGQMVEVPVRQADGDRLLDGRGHGAPRAPEQPRDLLPGQRAGPRRQRHQQCVRHLLLPTHPGHRLDMHAGASRAPHAARRVAQRHRDPPQRYMAEAPYWTGVSVRAPRPTLAASGHEAAVWGQLGHQSARVSRHRHDPKPLQFHRRLDQTFQEHESPLRYPGCVTTPKYLMRLMFFNSQPSSACIHLYDEPAGHGCGSRLHRGRTAGRRHHRAGRTLSRLGVLRVRRSSRR